MMGLGRRRDLATGYLGEAPKQGVCFSLVETRCGGRSQNPVVTYSWLALKFLVYEVVAGGVLMGG